MDAKAWDDIAGKYFDEIQSPFRDAVYNPLFEELDRIPESNRKHVADLGTGPGNLLPVLSKKFRKVTAIDFSIRMLKIAKAKVSRKNIRFEKANLCNLAKFHNSFDVAVAVNSFLTPSLKQLSQKFQESSNILKKGGKFIGVFPSVTADLYRALLTFERELEKTNDEELAKRRARRLVMGNRYDLLFGILDNEGKQKYFYEFGIKYRLKKAGFKKIRFRKILYSWDVLDYPEPGTMPKDIKPWDWLVIAEKA